MLYFTLARQKLEEWLVTNLENDQFQLGDVIRMYPVLGCLSHKVLLSTTCRRVTLDRVTLGSDQVIEPGKFHDERVVIVFEKWLGIQSGSKHWLQIPPCLFLCESSAQQS
jgi:hypothetical protein